MEVDEIYRKIINRSIPSEDKWDQLCEIINFHHQLTDSKATHFGAISSTTSLNTVSATQQFLDSYICVLFL